MRKLGNLGRLVSVIFLVGVLGLTFGLKKCQQGNADSTGVMPINRDLDIPFTTYDYNSDLDTTFYTETGTALTFLAGSLVSSDGKLVNGFAQVKIREFHDATAILRAGIPMRLRSDKNAFLQSSGMLEIRAYQDGKELSIAPGKFIGTELAAYRSSKGHQLYFLKDNSDWETRDTFITKLNHRRETKLQKLFRSKNEGSGVTIPGDIVFELFGDVESAPELEAWRGQKWKIAKENVTPDFFEAMHINWDSTKVIRKKGNKDRYKLAFWKTLNQIENKPIITKHFTVDVVPVSGKGDEAKIRKVMENRFLKEDSIKKDLAIEIDRVKKEAELVNVFKINKMGIWNIDRAIKLSDFIPVRVSFDFQSTFKSFQKVRLFCVLKEDNSVVDFLDWQKEPIFLSVERPMQIAAVLPSGNIVYVDFDQIRQRLAQGSKEITFTTKERTAQDYFSYLSKF